MEAFYLFDACVKFVHMPANLLLFTDICKYYSIFIEFYSANFCETCNFAAEIMISRYCS